jgi:hypothetical protein
MDEPNNNLTERKAAGIKQVYKTKFNGSSCNNNFLTSQSSRNEQGKELRKYTGDPYSKRNQSCKAHCNA